MPGYITLKLGPTFTRAAKAYRAPHQLVERGQEELGTVDETELPEGEADVLLCVVGGVILSIVQVNNDFTQLGVFYKGFMGRKLFIKEHLLVTRDKAEVRRNNDSYENNIVDTVQVLASLVEPSSTSGDLSDKEMCPACSGSQLALTLSLTF